MKPPKRIKIGPFNYRVAVGGRDWDAARLRESDDSLIGHHSPESLTIAMQGGLAAGAEREVLLHETLHACYNAVGQPLKDEEDAVRMLAPQLLATLRDNPGLVAYLIEEDN